MVTLVSLNKQLEGTGYSLKYERHTRMYELFRETYLPKESINQLYTEDILGSKHLDFYKVHWFVSKYLSTFSTDPDVRQLIKTNQIICDFTKEQCQQYLVTTNDGEFRCGLDLVEQLRYVQTYTHLHCLFSQDVQHMFNNRCQQFFKPQSGDMVLGRQTLKPNVGDMVLGTRH